MSDRTENRAWLMSASEQIPTALVAFGQALEEAGALGDGWSYFLICSEKWTEEFAAWQSCGEPHEGDTGWPHFLIRLEEIQG